SSRACGSCPPRREPPPAGVSEAPRRGGPSALSRVGCRAVRVDVVDLETCATATGTVVVIDVLRAFTTAALAFAAGAAEIRPVATIDEVLAARDADPSLLAMGEIEGMPVAGFDFDNSPAGLAARAHEVAGRVLVQRTTAGTQGLVRSVAAERL